MGERLHLVMKYSADMYDTKDMILLHNQIALRKEAVWLGKPYHVMSQKALEKMNGQIADGFFTCIYLIDNKRTRPIAHFAELLSLSMRAPKETELIPPFYREKKIRSRMVVWLKVGFLKGFYLEDFPELEKQNKFYEQAVSLADKCSEYFLMYEDV